MNKMSIIENWMISRIDDSMEDAVIRTLDSISETHNIQNFEDIYLMFSQLRMDQKNLIRDFVLKLEDWSENNIAPKEAQEDWN